MTIGRLESCIAAGNGNLYRLSIPMFFGGLSLLQLSYCIQLLVSYMLVDIVITLGKEYIWRSPYQTSPSKDKGMSSHNGESPEQSNQQDCFLTFCIGLL